MPVGRPGRRGGEEPAAPLGHTCAWNTAQRPHSESWGHALGPGQKSHTGEVTHCGGKYIEKDPGAKADRLPQGQAGVRV